MKHVRNFGIVALLALGVWALPGGNTAANLFGALLFVVLTIGIGLLAARFYMDRQSDLYSLGDGYRLLLYAAIGLIVLVMAASSKLFDTGGGTILWIVLLAAAIGAILQVFRRAREY